MSSSNAPRKLSAYSGALKALSIRTGTPLSSLVLSFGILHEVTAVAPLFIFFYGARTFGVGDKLIKTITEDPSFNIERESTPPPKDLTQWGKQKLSSWVTEGDRWAARVGTRYGIFGYEKRKPGEKPDVDALTHKPGHLAGDVANAVVAYAVTKTRSLALIFTKAAVSYMPKLKFKRTPEEEAEHQARKARRKERKRKRAESDRYHCPHGSSSKRAHNENSNGDDGVTRNWASSDEDEERASKAEDTRPPLSRDAAYAEMQFRQKMFDAMGEDERLDGLESHFNDFVHIPDRWKQAATATSETYLYDADDFLKLNPNTLDDEEYAEWMRLGMYRKSHAAEHAEQVRRKAVAEERRAAEKARRAEARRLEKQAEEERRKKRKEREAAKKMQAKEEYHAKWKLMLEGGDESGPLTFGDIPWPIYCALGEDAFSKESISSFLLSGIEGDRKGRKEILRETLLRFHPDKFEGRFMGRVAGSDRERVQESVGQISRVLNHLLEEYK